MPKSYVIIRLFFGLSSSDTLYYVKTTLFQIPEKHVLITLEIRCLLVRSNYVGKCNLIAVRVGSSFLNYFFGYVCITY